MGRIRMFTCAASLALAALGAPAVAHAQPSVAPVAPPYTLRVETDAPAIVSYETIAKGLETELGAAVAPGGQPTKARIVIRYTSEPQPTVAVRATRADGSTLERSVEARGDAEAVRRAAILLAGNVARDEASELLEGLAPKPKPPEPEPVAETPTPPATPEPERFAVATLSLAYPIATNMGRPDVRTPLAFSFFYDHIGTSTALQLGLGVAVASRASHATQIGLIAALSGGRATGVQLGLGGALARGPVDGVQASVGFSAAKESLAGAQLSAGANFTRGAVDGAQVAGAFNVAGEDVRGLQLAGGLNLAPSVDGAQLGIVNVGRRVRGLQLGVVNVAEDVEGAALGLVSITRDGVHPIVWTSNASYVNAGVKFATKYTYTITAVGIGAPETDWGAGSAIEKVGVAFAIGGRIPVLAGAVGTLAILPEMGGYLHDAGPTQNFAMAPRVLAEMSFASHFSLLAGAGVRKPVKFDRGSEDATPEFVFGVQF